METRLCLLCQKDISDRFHTAKYCVDCGKKVKYAYVRRWIKKHPDRYKELAGKYRQKYREEYRVYSREYYWSHKKPKFCKICKVQLGYRAKKYCLVCRIKICRGTGAQQRRKWSAFYKQYPINTISVNDMWKNFLNKTKAIEVCLTCGQTFKRRGAQKYCSDCIKEQCFIRAQIYYAIRAVRYLFTSLKKHNLAKARKLREEIDREDGETFRKYMLDGL